MSLNKIDLISSGADYEIVNLSALAKMANNEPVFGWHVMIPEVYVEGVSLEKVLAFACDTCSNLAGQNILNQFDIRTSEGVMRLSKRN